MKLMIDISKDRYDEIMSIDWNNCRLIFDEELRAIHDGKALQPEPCTDAISRQAAIDALTKTSGIRGDALKALYDLPPVTPAEKVGRWVGIDEEPYEDYECNKCGYVVSTFTANIEPHTEYKYCPNCGAKMQEVEDD